LINVHREPLMDKLAEFMLRTDLRFQQLQDQLDAQQLVMAWLLSHLQDTDVFQPDQVRQFLYDQSNELADSPKFEEFVAAIDALFEDFVRLSSQRRRRD
jgi:hemerythrin